jgi:hypothetical protein
MTKLELQIRNFNYKTDLPSQRALFLECFPENAGTPVVTNEHYLWKFHSSSPDFQSFEYGAWINEEIVGYYAAIKYPYTYSGKVVKAGMVCDVMTGIKARGQGVFTQLGAYALGKISNEKLGFLTGFPIRKEVIPGHKKAGWEFPFIIPMFGKFLSLSSFLISRRLSWLRYLLNPILSFFNLVVKYFRRNYASVETERYSSEEIDSILGFGEFLSEVQKQNLISLNKDIMFLKWRLGAPGKKYAIAVLKVNKVIVGYAVGRYVIKENVPCFGVLDLSLLRGFEKYSSALFTEIERIAYEQKAELILIMILKGIASKYRFPKNGWLRTPYNFSFIIKLNSSITDQEILMDEKNWFLTWLDSDDL